MNKNRKRRSYEILRKVLGVTLSLIMVLTTVFGGIGGSLMEKVGLGVDEAYAKDISKKNEQACDSCNRVKSGTAPDGYTIIPDGIDVGSQSVYRGGNSFSGWADNFYDGYGLDTDPNDFAKPLPYGDVYIDTTKMNFEDSNKNNFIIDIQDSRFKWISSGTPIKDAAYSDSDPTAHISTTDPMGQGRGVVGANPSIAYVGPLQSYLPDIKDAATNDGYTNDITPSGEYLYRITYKNAATLPNGTKGNVVITATRAQIETSITVDDTHPRVLSDGSGEYSYNKALVVVHEANELAVVGGLKDSSGNYINEYDTVAKTAFEVQAQMDAAKAKGAKFNTDQYNKAVVEDKYLVHATGVILDLEIKVVDGEGNPVEGTISYAAHDLDLQTSQNAWGRKVTTGTSEDTKFAEGMTIVSGAQSYALTPNYGKNGGIGNFGNISTGNQKDGWVEHGPAEAQPESPLLIEGGSDKTANGVRFSSRGIAAIRGVDGTFADTPFNNAKDAGSQVNNGCVVLVTNQPYNRGGQIQNKDWYTKTDQSYKPNSLIRNLMMGKAKKDDGSLVTNAADVNYRYVYNGVGNALWKTARNDNEKSFDTGFAVLLDAEKSEVQWSGSYGHSGSVRTRLFDTTVFTYIEQTHGTGGGIYLEDYKLHDDCEPVGREGVVTMGRGASATVTAVPEEGYRVKRFLIGGEGLTNSKEYTLENLGLTPGTHDTVTRDGITFEMNTDGTVDVGFAEVTDPRHVHVDFTADYYFYKVWKGDETPTKLELTAVPYAYIFTDVTLPAPAGTDPDAPYTDTKFSINGAEYTATDGTKYTLSPNNTLESNKKDGAGDPLVTLPYVLKGNSFVNETTGASYPVTIQFGVNFAMGDGTTEDSVKQTFTVKGTETEYVTVLNDGGSISPGNVVWKIKYPASGVSSLGWPALPVETEPSEHNVNHVERNYWFVTEKAPAGWSKESYDNSKAEAPGVVPTVTGEHDGYYDNHVWAAASTKDYVAATTMIQQDNKTKNAFMSVFSKDANTDKETYGGEISNVPAVVVKAEKTWDDLNNAFNTRKDIWLHIDAIIDGVTKTDILPPQKLAPGTSSTETVTWGDMKVYETNQANVKIISKLADIPLQDENGRRVTYTHATDGSYKASNGITYWLNELVKVDSKGNTIEYTIRETLDSPGKRSVEPNDATKGLIGYTAEETGDKVAWDAMSQDGKTKIGEDGNQVEVLTYEGKFENKLELIDFTIQKVWDDADDQDGYRPDNGKVTYEVKLGTSAADATTLATLPTGAIIEQGKKDVTSSFSSGKITIDTTGADGDTITLKNLPAYKDGKKAVYVITEEAIEHYTTEVTGNADDGFVVTNTHEPEKLDIHVAKEWDDANNQDGKRPKSIVFQLIADSVAKETLELSESNSWKGSFKNLDKKKAGNDIVYTSMEQITEELKKAVYEASAPSGKGTEGDPVTIKNTHSPEKVTISATKVWDDQDNKYGIRKAVILTLYADGKPIEGSERTIAPDAEGEDLTVKWEDLDRYRNGGTEIEYTIQEANVSPYSQAITGDAENGYTVKNTYPPITETKTVTRTIVYTYIDENGQEASETVTQTVKLERVPTVVDEEGAVVEWSDWDYAEDNPDTGAVTSPEIDGWISNRDVPEWEIDLKDPKDAYEHVIYTPKDPVGKPDETYGGKGQPQTGTPTFEVTTPTTPNGSENQIVETKLLDEDGNPVNEVTVPDGTYKLNNDGTITFTPSDPNFVGDPTPVKVKGTDANGRSAETTYTPHIVDNTDTVKRTITYEYGDGTPVLDENDDPLTVIQEVTFTGTVDPKTGEVTFPQDNPDNEKSLEEVQSPVIDEYTADKESVKEEKVHPGDDDLFEKVIYNPNDLEATPDETYGLVNEPQTGEPQFTLLTTTLPDGTPNEIVSRKLIDPATGETTDGPVTIDGQGTYTLNDDGTITFTPEEGYVGNPTPIEIMGTDKLGKTAKTTYTPHVVDPTDEGKASRTIHYTYSTKEGTKVTDDTVQTVTLTRHATKVDPKTGEALEWGPWESATFLAVENPDEEAGDGWRTTDKVDSLTVSEPGDVPDEYVVYLPDPPKGDKKETWGPKNTPQSGKPEFTKGTGEITKYELIDPETGTPTDKPVKVEGGEYTIDPKTGVVTFTPDKDYVGNPTPITVQATDEHGKTATGTYTPHIVENEETGTIKRKITYVYDDTGETVLDEDGNPLTKEQETTVTRTGTVNPDTGEVTWGPWKEGKLDEVPSPAVDGYTPDKRTVESVTGTPDNPPSDVEVRYKRTFTVTYLDGEHGKSDGNGNEKDVPSGDNVGDNTDGENTVTPDSGWRFTGKYTYVITKPDGTTETGETDDPTSVVVTGDVEFTPIYEEIPPTPGPNPPTPVDPTPEKTYWTTYVDPDGTTIYLEKTYKTVGAAEPPAPANPTKDGYTFDGWDRSVDSDGNITYTARWVPVTTPVDPTPSDPVDPTPVDPTPVDPTPGEPTIWVRYIDGDGNEIYMDKTTFDQTVGEPQGPANPTKDGFIFDGWDRTVDSAGNITYIARWKPVSSTTPSQAKPATNVAKTGDQSNAGMWIGILAIAVLVALIAVLVRVRNKNK